MRKQVLVLGDNHVYDYDFPSRRSYTEEFVRQLERQGHEVAVTYHVPLTLELATRLIPHLSLYDYDIILVGLGQADWLAEATGLRGWLNFAFRRLARRRQQLSGLLDGLYPHRYRTLILTPPPHREPLFRRLCRAGSRWTLQEGRRRDFSVFDIQSIIGAGEEFFRPDSPVQLSAISHELIGRRLYDYYRGETTLAPPREYKPPRRA